MQFTAQQISSLLKGTVEGDPTVAVSSLSKIEEGVVGSVSFLSNSKYINYVYTTKASIVIINNSFKLTQKVSCTLIRVEDAYTAFSVLLEAYNSVKLNKQGIETPSFVHPTAKLGKNIYLGAFAYIGENVTIGDNTKIYPHSYVGDNSKVGNNVTLFSGVKIYHECIIGNNAIIHSGAVIGADGFGFAPQEDGSYKKISQTGNVIIEDNVELGANTCIDRATIGSTIIKKGVKLDNLIQVAHNAEIGTNTVIASQSGVAGSTKIGEQCVIGGQVGVVGHIRVAKGSQIQGQTGINRSITQEGKKWGGSPASLFQDYLRSQIVVNRLPALEHTIEELQKQLEELKNKHI